MAEFEVSNEQSVVNPKFLKSQFLKETDETWTSKIGDVQSDRQWVHSLSGTSSMYSITCAVSQGSHKVIFSEEDGKNHGVQLELLATLEWTFFLA